MIRTIKFVGGGAIVGSVLGISTRAYLWKESPETFDKRVVIPQTFPQRFVKYISYISAYRGPLRLIQDSVIFSGIGAALGYKLSSLGK